MRITKTFLSVIVLIAAMAVWTSGQTTEFTYQGSLKDGGTVANGNYDLEFRLYDAASGGGQIGTTVISKNNVAVTGGVFSVAVDFGPGLGGPNFPGADRYLDIRVRPVGGGAFTPLSPRNRINSTPYAVQSLNAANALQLGGVGAGQYVITNDPRLTDARPPTSGSPSYIQNGTVAQSASNFNISGTGTANQINSLTDYRINGFRILASPGINMFAGEGAGVDNTGLGHAFFGSQAGLQNSTGDNNSFFGFSAGMLNLNGSNNAYFGDSAGFNATGSQNSFFGSRAGSTSIFGPLTGSGNTFIGYDAGGDHPGLSVNNTLVGSSTVLNEGLVFATAIGAGSVASQSNSVHLGRSNGADTVRIPGAVIIQGSLVVDTLGGTTGNVHLCRNTANRISLCTSNFAQRGENEALIDRLNDQQKQIEALKKIVCSLKPEAEVCGEM